MALMCIACQIMRIAPQMKIREVRLTLMIVLMVVKYVREIVIVIMRIGDL